MTIRLVLLGITMAISSLASDERDTWFVDKNLVYEQGHALSQKYLNKHTPSLSQVRKNALPWIVRIEAQHTFNNDNDAFTSNHGTGIILKGGIVVTAYHVFTKNIPADNKKLKILLTMVDGRVFPATLLKHGPRDWALLKINFKELPSKELMQSPITMKDPIPGEPAIFLGYPARLGIDNNGKVQSFHKGDSKKNIPTSKLLPMTIVASVSDVKSMRLTPLAGFPPVGGMSGGPILNSKGEIIGLQHGVTKTTENATGKVLSYSIDATSASDVPAP